MYTLYILYSALRDRYYTGFTGSNMLIRLKKHNTAHAGFTGKTLDWRIVYTEEFADKRNAMQREIEIKKWKSRKLIEKLIG